MKMGEKLRSLKQVGMLLIALSISGCEKPSLKTDSLTEEADGEVKEKGLAAPATSFEEIRKSVIGQTFETLTLGSRKFTQATVRNITDRVIVVAHAGGVDEVLWSEVPSEVRKAWGYDSSVSLLSQKPANLPAEEKEMKTVESTKPPEIQNPKLNSRERAMEIEQKQKMLEAQLAGIQSLESDLARQSQPLNSLRKQLAALKARQTGQGSKKVMVEMVGGTSTRVDRKKEAAEVENKIKAQEQLVAQLSQSLQAARTKYASMKAALDQLKEG